VWMCASEPGLGVRLQVVACVGVGRFGVGRPPDLQFQHVWQDLAHETGELGLLSLL
jgi:hypothetical protein